MGGLRPGGRDKMIALKDFLRHHWQEVNQRTKQPFNYEVLNNNEYIYDTEPSCRSVVTMRNMNPSREFEYYKRVQEAFYRNGEDMNDLAVFSLISKEFNVNENEFRETFLSDKIRKETIADFTYSQQIGIRGFPTTVLDNNEKLYLIANGYMDAGSLVSAIKGILDK